MRLVMPVHHALICDFWLDQAMGPDAAGSANRVTFSANEVIFTLSSLVLRACEGRIGSGVFITPHWDMLKLYFFKDIVSCCAKKIRLKRA